MTEGYPEAYTGDVARYAQNVPEQADPAQAEEINTGDVQPGIPFTPPYVRDNIAEARRRVAEALELDIDEPTREDS